MKAALLLLLAFGSALVSAVDPAGLGAVITAGPQGVTQLKVQRVSPSAGYSNRLVVYAADFTTLISSLGDNQTTNINSRGDPGNTFTASSLSIAAGAELVFTDLICADITASTCTTESGTTGPFQTSNGQYFTGPGSRNTASDPSGIAHAYVVSAGIAGENSYLLGFEDLPKANSDLDYNDLQVKIILLPTETLLCDGQPCRKLHLNLFPHHVRVASVHSWYCSVFKRSYCLLMTAALLYMCCSNLSTAAKCTSNAQCEGCTLCALVSGYCTGKKPPGASCSVTTNGATATGTCNNAYPPVCGK
jgi:hypothetical protein